MTALPAVNTTVPGAAGHTQLHAVITENATNFNGETVVTSGSAVIGDSLVVSGGGNFGGGINVGEGANIGAGVNIGGDVSISGQLTIPESTIVLGTTDSVNLYRVNANTLATDDSFTVGNYLFTYGGATITGNAEVHGTFTVVGSTYVSNLEVYGDIHYHGTRPTVTGSTDSQKLASLISTLQTLGVIA